MFDLPKLPYPINALEPTLSNDSMDIHYNVHFKGYIDKLNKTIEKYPDLQSWSASKLLHKYSKLPEEIQEPIKNYAGGYLNHLMFFQILSPYGGGTPKGDLAKQIKKDFGTYNKFKEEFISKSMKLFGSGWTWLILRNDKLVIETLPNQDNPIIKGELYVFGLDLWEHAWQFQYEGDREKFLNAIWKIFNWPEMELRFIKIRK
jgi:Fe-Mn family superoxide dismutase